MDEHTRQLRDTVLEATEAALEAQLRAIRTLRRAEPPDRPKRERGRSQVDMAFDILHASAEPLHIAAIIDGIEQRFGVRVDRESLVSALSKRVARRDRFCRVGRNVFGAIRAEEV